MGGGAPRWVPRRLGPPEALRWKVMGPRGLGAAVSGLSPAADLSSGYSGPSSHWTALSAQLCGPRGSAGGGRPGLP